MFHYVLVLKHPGRRARNDARDDETTRRGSRRREGDRSTRGGLERESTRPRVGARRRNRAFGFVRGEIARRVVERDSIREICERFRDDGDGEFSVV